MTKQEANEKIEFLNQILGLSLMITNHAEKTTLKLLCNDYIKTLKELIEYKDKYDNK